jgi:hypothetical protein
MLNFIVLGLIPGTNIQITIAWLALFVVLVASLFLGVRHRSRLQARLKGKLPVVMLSKLR